MTAHEEYLSTSCERHSEVQGAAACYLRARYPGIAWVVFYVRVQLAQSSIRVPDVTVVLGSKPSGSIVTSPPFIVIEVLSPEDCADRVQTKIADYLEFGVLNVWVLDPKTKSAIAYSPEGVTPVFEGSLRTTNPVMELPLSELF